MGKPIIKPIIIEGKDRQNFLNSVAKQLAELGQEKFIIESINYATNTVGEYNTNYSVLIIATKTEIIPINDNNHLH